MKRALRLLATAVVASPIVGCISSNNDSLVEFRAHNPGSARRYIYLEPTGIELAEATFIERTVTVSDILRSVKANVNDPIALRHYLDRVVAVENTKREEQERLFSELDHWVTVGGTVCEYKWSDGQFIETGILVIKSGNVVKRVPWITERKGDSSSTGTSN
jgi:hypothetical protein